MSSAGLGALRAKRLVITPPSLLAVLRSGWSPLVPLLHPSALRGLRRRIRECDFVRAQ